MRFLALCVGIILVSTATGDSTDQTVRTINVDNCPDYPNLPNKLDKGTIVQFYENQAQLFFSGTVQLNEQFKPNGSWVEVTLYRCLSDDRNSCDKFRRIVEPDLCAHLADKDAMWAKFVEKMQDDGFDPVCPTETGIYSVSSVLIDLSFLVEEGLTSSRYYEIKLLFKYIEEPLMCVVATGLLKHMRKNKKHTKYPTDAGKRSLARSGASLNGKSSDKRRTASNRYWIF